MKWYMRRGPLHSVAFVAIAIGVLSDAGLRAQETDNVDASSPTHAVRTVKLAPTVHPAIPSRPTDFWYVPESFPRTGAGRSESPSERFARAARLVDGGEFTTALPLLTPADLSGTPLASYALYYRALALAGLNRVAEATELLDRIKMSAPGQRGYLLDEAIPLKHADLDVARQSARNAVETLDELSKAKFVTSPEEVWLRLGRAAEAAGDRSKAVDAYRKVYYESPLSLQALDAQNLLARLDEATPADRFKLELARAERIFNTRRWAQARAGFAPLAGLASGDDRELIALRLAECDYYLDRFRASRDALMPYLANASRKAEARFFYLTATRALGDHVAYVLEARALVDEFADSSWALETLNNLASHYVIVDDDAAADGVFRELVRRFPESRYAERALWKIGWWAYRNGRFADAAEAFDTGSSTFPRGDTRPAWLYWSGRAHDQVGETAIANERYRIEIADYGNSYYGRLAAKILEARGVTPLSDTVTVALTPATPPIPTASVIRQLLSLELYDAALKELQFAQRAWANSAAIEATIAWIRHEQAGKETAPERFDHLRGAINIMKRAYPQYLASGGEDLPSAVLEVIYPMDYWPLIEKYSKENSLDPYLMAALIAQESTFTADVRSSANAYGLMQLLPSNGRRYAQRLGIRPFSTASLTRPETNIRLGMALFKDLLDRFGGAHYALASYNAGDNRVAEWLDERPGLPQDEFIDDIPFPETQNYVKRILGTAEDYRRLYGEGRLVPGSLKDAPPTRPLRVTSKPKSTRKPPVQRVSRRKKTTR
jgi:peptidoglycan lytic transglycosylase